MAARVLIVRRGRCLIGHRDPVPTGRKRYGGINRNALLRLGHRIQGHAYLGRRTQKPGHQSSQKQNFYQKDCPEQRVNPQKRPGAGGGVHSWAVRCQCCTV